MKQSIKKMLENVSIFCFYSLFLYGIVKSKGWDAVELSEQVVILIGTIGVMVVMASYKRGE